MSEETIITQEYRIQERFFSRIDVESLKHQMYDKDIAALAGISASHYCMMRKCQKPISISSMIKVAAVFDLVIQITFASK